MRVLLQLLVEMFRLSRTRAVGRDTPTRDYLKPLVILAVALVAGPDILAAIELSTLLELLGAAMFLLSFAIGLKLLGLAALEELRNLLLPVPYLTLAKARGYPTARIHGVLLICRHNLLPCCFILTVIVALVQLVR